jgi:high-affinity K+ transport system ATPase subunit B
MIFHGAIYLKDIIKPGIKEQADQLRRMGIRTVMLDGRQPDYCISHCGLRRA